MRFQGWLTLAKAFEHLVPALLHTLWQAALVGLLLALLLSALPATRARLRYCVSLGALLSIVVGWSVTWSILEYTPPYVEIATAISSTESSVATTAARNRAESVGRDRGEASSTPARNAGAQEAANERTSDDVTAGGSPWRGFVGRFWMAGVVLMCLRLIVMVTRARRAGQASYSLDDPRLHEAFAQLQTAFAIVRRVRLGVSKHLVSPAVYGAVWPTVLLPVAILGELSAEQLRFVLAHELAHIRRHDYLLNLVQLGIEALLFFNPAVWWISRQIRLEREACCDALAIRVTGSSFDYARLLLQWTEHARSRETRPQASLTFAEAKRSGQLRDRVARILFPAQRPALGVSPLGLCGLIVIGATALAGLSKTTGVAVTLAAAVVTPSEAIEPQSLYNKMVENSADHFKTVRGKYLQRTFHARSAKHDAQHVDDVLKQVRRSQAEQDERAKKNGWPLKDRQLVETELQSLRAELVEQQHLDTHTAVVTYIGAGEKYFYQMFPVDQTGTLEEIRSAGVKPRADESLLTWNGKESANLNRPLEKYPNSPGVLALGSKKFNLTNPTRYGHDVPALNWWTTTFLRLQGQSVEQVKTPEGEDAVRLSIGSAENSLLGVEMTILPSKGYAVRSSNDRHGGSLAIPEVRIKEEMSDFVLAAPGIWMPRHVTRETYDADDKLQSRLEFLALEDPQVDLPVDDRVFDQSGVENVSVIDQRARGGIKSKTAVGEVVK